MNTLKLKMAESNFTKLLTRAQMKLTTGGEISVGKILCYCDSPILSNGQYGNQWLADSCETADISTRCGGANLGTCGAC
ncbi:MAG: hypothetical protein B7Y37_13635 [Sphingobacteriia bacterium 28-36-52]|nr:MAG: hypothetical protein B7Y37_13635 [Sphingobacteriia bacterium 28-36-52]